MLQRSRRPPVNNTGPALFQPINQEHPLNGNQADLECGLTGIRSRELEDTCNAAALRLSTGVILQALEDLGDRREQNREDAQRFFYDGRFDAFVVGFRLDPDAVRDRLVSQGRLPAFPPPCRTA